jgi:hypothetical protein
LQFGDKNSKFCHACANQRRKSNQIRSIRDEQGLLRETQEEIGTAFTNYFSNLFDTEGVEHIEEILITVDVKVSDRTEFGYSQENEPLGRIALRKYRDRTTENGVL